MKLSRYLESAVIASPFIPAAYANIKGSALDCSATYWNISLGVWCVYLGIAYKNKIKHLLKKEKNLENKLNQ